MGVDQKIREQRSACSSLPAILQAGFSGKKRRLSRNILVMEIARWKCRRHFLEIVVSDGDFGKDDRVDADSSFPKTTCERR